MPRYVRNPAFVGLRDNGFYLQHESGSCVSVDEALFDIWQAADGCTVGEILAKMGSRYALDADLLDAVLRLMVRADLLASDAPRSVPVPFQSVSDGPLVSVVVLNMNGLQHLQTCLSSLLAQTYRQTEIILVDNGSTDGSVGFVQEHFPVVRVVALAENRGFSEGINAGIRIAEGRFVFVLNNDTEVEPGCIAEMMRVASSDGQIAAVSPMIKFFYLRGFVNSLGTIVNPIGWGTDSCMGHLDVGQFREVREIYASCFGAALLRREVLDEIGGLDTGFGIGYYEDVDWCYRARLAGYAVVLAPRAVVYHKFGATTRNAPTTVKLRLVARNRLRFVVKNLQMWTALCFGLSYLAEDIYHVLLGVLRRDWPSVRAYADAWAEFACSWRDLLHQRRLVQGTRVPGSTDKRLFAPAAQVAAPRVDNELPYLSLQDLRDHYLPLASGSSRRVLIVSPDVVASNMAGPGIRCWELARALSREFDVTLAVPGASDLQGDAYRVVSYAIGRTASLEELVSRVDTVIVSGYLLEKLPFLEHAGKPLVVDLYDPFVVENLHFHASKPLIDRATIHQNDLAVLNHQLSAGDFFLCASEKQRDYCIGLLMANNRVNPYTWDDDPTMRRLIDVVPFGLRSERPRSAVKKLKGVLPGIASDDQVILWGGGVWEWLDPLTAVRAMVRVVQTCPKARLFFLGTRHPNQEVPMSGMCQAALELSRQLGLLDKSVFFGDWTPYAEREGYLLEAEVGIALHHDHLETRLSFRTRLLDYIWARLPVVVSKGDTLGEMLASEGLATTVACEDVDGVACALIHWLSTPDARLQLEPAFARVAEKLTWEQAAEPLVAFCRDPRVAADRKGSTRTALGLPTALQPTPVWRLPARAWRVLCREGLGGLRREAVSYVRWLLTRLV